MQNPGGMATRTGGTDANPNRQGLKPPGTRGCRMSMRLGLALPLIGIATASAQQLDLPRSAPIDQPLPIRVSGLPAGALVHLRVSATDATGREWSSRATFRADASGTVATDRDAPRSGAYAGVDPGALFNRMAAANDSTGRQRFAQNRLANIVTNIVLEDSAAATLSSALVERFFLAPGVQQSVVSDSGLRARFFTPEHTPAPGVVVLGGSEGGFPDDVAAILASNGYATLSLAYFGVQGLPSELAEIPLEYFERALAWLRANPAVIRDRVAIVATSKGAEVGLLVASRVPAVKAVVGYVPSSVAWFCICQDPRSSWSLSGKGVAAVPPGTDPSYRPASGEAIRPVVNYLYRLRRMPSDAVIPVERIAAPLLLIAGDDDQLWPSLLMSRAIVERRAKRGRHVSDELLVYRGAGHLIGKAYMPAGSTRIAGGRIETGGTPNANARAQADAWPRVLAFLRKALR